MADSSKKRVLNFNVGVLGHVDSGKTSLAKSLSTIASTASFDKNPQSRERGITLDLGFSSFQVPLPGHLTASEPYDMLQFTLVDCPGHASLIKTIIGGAQIIDMMLLVVDAVKGVQTQTAECLVIGEILCEKMVVALNKIDLLKVEKRSALIEKVKKKLSATLSKTKFAGCPIIPVAAKPGGPESPDTEPVGVQQLIDMLSSLTYLPSRDPSGSLTFAVDHCFSIRGQGTIMTGTILSGSIAVNDTVEIPSMKMTKKVKSMQMFKHPIEKATQGDRVGICVTQFDPKLLERGLVCSPSSVPTVVAGIVNIKKISYYKGSITSKSKFHITIGHETVMGKLQIFGLPPGEEVQCDGFNFEIDYVFQEEVIDLTKSNMDADKENESATLGASAMPLSRHQWALIEFEKPVTCPENSLVIGSRLDTDIHLNTCRIAFHGKLLVPITDKAYTDTVLPKLRVYKTKSREGVVERVSDDYSVIGRSLFKKETNIQNFVGLKVKLSTGEDGVIEGGFGQSGKVKVRIPSGLTKETIQLLSATAKKKGNKNKAAASSQDLPTDVPAASEQGGPVKIVLQFKRYIHDTKKKMIQA